MNIPMVNVTARAVDQQGNPLAGAHVSMRLSTLEKYGGFVVPRQADAVTDAAGMAVLRVWPNELGTEGSEYAVSISYGGTGNCGCNGGGTPFLTQRFSAVVPNSDCDLQDIAELPPYEKRSVGQVITSEVARYAASASSAADRAYDAISGVEAIKASCEHTAAACETALLNARQAASEARQHERNLGDLIQSADDKITHFEASVTQRTDAAAQTSAANAAAQVARAQTNALLAIEDRSGKALAEISQTVLDNRNTAVTNIVNVKTVALEEIRAAKTDALENLHEDAKLFGEDFLALTERAEAAAKRSGCSAAAADKAADRACLCAERAERAEANIRAVVLDAAAGIVSGEIMDEAAKKAKEGALVAARTIWGPLAEQIIRLTDRHTRDMAHFAREKIRDARWHQKINEARVRLNSLEAGF